MKTIAIALLLFALPFGAAAQMKCPDGSYRTNCPGGGGQAVGGDSVSSYTAPKRPPIQFNRDTSERYRSAGQAAQEGRPVAGPQSLDDRARGSGISRNDLVKARSRGTLLTGMARKDVDYIMGKPDDIRTYVNSNGRCDDLWYHEKGRGWHTRVTMCNGKLRSFGADNR